MSESVWTEERIAFLRRSFEAGMSCSEMARELGAGISRNSVIGKLHRLGLTRPKVIAMPGLTKLERRRTKYQTDPEYRKAILMRNREDMIRKGRGARHMANPQSILTGQIKFQANGLTRKECELTKTELRELFAQAVRNTAAMEIAG